MNTLFGKLAVFSVERRAIVAILLAVISGVAVVGHVQPRLVIDWIESFGDAEVEESRSPAIDSNQVRDLPKVSPFSLSRSDVVIVVESDDFFTSDAAKALRAVVKAVEDLDQVDNLIWMDRIPMLNIFGLPEPLFPRSEASSQRFAAARKKAMQHPLVKGQLLSNDGKTLLIMIGLNFAHVFDDDDATTLIRQTAIDAAAPFGDVDLRIRITGRVPSTIAAINAHESSQLKYQLVGYGVILVMTIILFRGIKAVLIVSVAPILGVFWTLGIIQFFEYHNNPLIDVIVPILISLVALTDGVHLMVQIRKLRTAGLSPANAAKTGLQQVGMACFLTSLTTAIGFGSLTIADSLWVQQFGMCCVVGVCLTFLSVVTVIPLLCSTWLGRNIHLGHENSLIDRNLNRITVIIDTVLKWRTTFSAAGIVLTLILFAVSTTLKPDQRQQDDLPEAAEATQALQHMDAAFGGLEFSRIDVRWNDAVASDDAEVLITVAAVDELLKAEPLIGNPLSIRNLIDAQPGTGPPEERMTMVELLPPPLKRAFYTPEENYAQVNFRVQDLGIATYGPVFERLNLKLAELKLLHPEFEFELRGNAVWRWKNLYQVVVDLARSLGTASLIIFLVLSVVYRSIRIGLISLIPNLFPLVLTGAYLAVAGFNLEIVMVCSFTVCLGIAVDDTIHFLTRYLEEYQENSDQDESIRRAFTGVGTALIMTTIVLVSGFSTVIFSDSRNVRIFATMGALTISAALLADLIFLPALLARFGPRRKSPRVSASSHTDS
ncbi:MAG: efflux RND transporter permease subunit [Fuerstiella sp.]